jgi:hypothetical protein
MAIHDVGYELDLPGWSIEKTHDAIISWASKNSVKIESDKTNEIILIHGKEILAYNTDFASRDYKKKMKFSLSAIYSKTHVSVIVSPFKTDERRPSKRTKVNYWWLINDIWSEAGDREARRRVGKIESMYFKRAKTGLRQYRIALILGLILGAIVSPITIWLLFENQIFQGDWASKTGITLDAMMTFFISISIILVVFGIGGMIYYKSRAEKLLTELESTNPIEIMPFDKK